MPADEEDGGNPHSPSPAAQEDDKGDNENSKTTTKTNATNSPTTNNAATARERRQRTDYPPATPQTSNVWNKKEEEETSVAARASLNLVTSVGEDAAARSRLATRGYDRSFDDIELNSLQTSSDCMAKLTCPVRPPVAPGADAVAAATSSLVSENAAAEAELTPRSRRRLFKSTAV